MRCEWQVHRGTAHGRHLQGTPCRQAVHGTPLHPPAGLTSEELQRLAATVAATIPLPGRALIRDEQALDALELLVIEAGRHLARAAGHDTTALTRALEGPQDDLPRALLLAALQEKKG